MKTKMIFSIAALLMLGNVCLNAQGNGEGATPTDYSKQPFTIVPNGSQITVTLEAPNDGMVWESFNMYYSKDGGETWTQQLVPDWFWIDVNADEKLMIRTVKSGNFGHLSVSGGTFNLEGNIMSLQDAHGWETATTVYTSFCEHLHDLFSGNTNLISAENLILPATAFDGNSGAYANMFSGCTSLMKAPELPATTLAESCYFNMFKGCTSLTTAPVLPATTLAENCYDNMFNGCTSLNYMKCLATDISASNCTLNWLNGVSSTGTFVKASSMNNDWSRGASGIPNGWTVSNDESVPSTPTDYSKQPFTIVAHNEDVTIRMIANSSESFEDVQFSTDKGQTWSGPGNTDLFYKVIPANTTLSLRGYFLRYLSSLEISGGTFDVEGNIASLRADYEERNKWHTYTGAINLKGLFSGHTNLISAENLVLPSTTLAQYCYQSLFEGCTSLIAAPQLPATTLAANSYNYMFAGCSSLTTAPVLPATTLASNCYSSMFEGCTSLTSVPNTLPATTLTHGCYSAMFFGCTSLTTAPVLPATLLANYCYSHMFYNCTSLTTAPELPATTLADYCYQVMFESCTSLTTAPVLPATTLANYCYKGMFQGCTSLNYIKCLATDVSATYCTNNWLDGVSSSGTFVKNASMKNWASGASGIPSGWTVSNDGTTPSTPTDYSAQYLTFVAIEDGTFSFSGSSSSTIDNSSIQYSLDSGSTWNTLDRGVQSPTVSAGNIIMWKGNFNAIIYNGIGYFSSTGRFDVEGNVMSLLYGDNFQNQTDLTEFINSPFGNLFRQNENVVNAEKLILPATALVTYSYYLMFYNCTSLTKAPTLPATTLANSCYYGMFRGCTSLTAAPVLPATTLEKSCYESMFQDCTSLTTMPTLSATTLAYRCYSYMFEGCTSLTAAPVLPATTLANNCYYGMFRGCTSLTKAPALPSTTLAEHCYQQMFAECTSLTTTPNNYLPATTLAESCYCDMFDRCTSLTAGPELPAITLANMCYYGMFKGCTSLTKAPTLPATTLANMCYQNMFSGCTNLKYIECFATDISATDCTRNWLSSVSSSGTFVKNASMNSWSSGIYGIPNGWTITNAQTNQTKRTIHVATAGTLPDLISEDEKYEIKELTLTGELNGTDFKFIREMAGVNDYYEPDGPDFFLYHNRTDGQLKSLDISEVNIVKGGSAYSFYRFLEPEPTIGRFWQSDPPFDFYISDNSISNQLFSLTLLESIILPNNVVSIGDYAFYGCSNLVSITIPNSVMSIGRGAFSGTEWFNNQPDGLVYAGKVAYCFKGEMPANTYITIKDGTLGIANYAFYNCSGLTSITIPNGVTSIGSSTFSSCSGLTSITIPNGVTSIGSSAFSGCSGLTTISFPSTVASFGDYVFNGCSALKSIMVESSNQKYDSRNNCNAIIETSSNTMILGCMNSTIPNSVTSIGNYAFYNCSGLTSITIPNGVTSIGNYAFSGCSGLTSITIPNGVTSIGYCALFRCSGLTSVTIPNSVTSIGNSTFSGCSGLTSVTIPNSVTSIGDRAFSGCSGLTSVTIPNSVTSIGINAFIDCSSLTKVVSKIKNPFIIDAYVFSSDIYTNAELVVPAGTKSLYEVADGWNKFSKITTEHLPTLETLPAQPTSTTKARLIALANEEDDEQHFGFEWLRNDAPANMPANKVSAPLYDGRIIGSLGGLNPDIYYKYRAFYKSDAGEMVYGEWVPFLTGDANVFFEPEVHTKDAIVTNDGALLSAVFVEGTEDIQEKGFEYWQKNSNARAVSLTRGNNIGSVIVSGNNTSVTIEGLKAGTEYGYRPYVKTASGITYGEEKTFKTSMFGDVNGDNKVDYNDLNDLVSYIMGNIPAHFNKDAADLNNDSVVNAADIVKMVKILK